MGMGLLVLGLLVGGAIGALAGNAGSEVAAPATTTTPPTTTIAAVEVTYPTAEPAATPLPDLTRDGTGPDPLLAIGLGTEEVIVRVTEAGPELLPVDAPGWVMGLGHAAAGYYDGFWVYVAPLDGSPLRRLPVVGRPDNDGALLSWVTRTASGTAVARVDLDDPELAVTVDPDLPFDLGVDPNTLVAASDPDGVVLHFPGNEERPYVVVDREAAVVDLAEPGFLALAPDAVAVAAPESPAIWVSRATGEPVTGPSAIEGCDWPYRFQGGTSLWWCTDGYYAESAAWTVQADGGVVGLFDEGQTIVTVQPGGTIEVFRPAQGDWLLIQHDDALVSAVRP